MIGGNFIKKMQKILNIMQKIRLKIIYRYQEILKKRNDFTQL